jgi:hypothetical protein
MCHDTKHTNAMNQFEKTTDEEIQSEITASIARATSFNIHLSAP